VSGKNGLRIESSANAALNGKCDASNYNNTRGVRLDQLLDQLTTWQAHGVPDGASITFTGDKVVQANWIEERG
jgi:hypothetical protein